MFQWGWGRSLIGLDEAVPIAWFVPMMMFAILFGLSIGFVATDDPVVKMMGVGLATAVADGVPSSAFSSGERVEAVVVDTNPKNQVH